MILCIPEISELHYTFFYPLNTLFRAGASNLKQPVVTSTASSPRLIVCVGGARELKVYFEVDHI